MKILLYRSRIIKKSDLSNYNMPFLETEDVINPDVECQDEDISCQQTEDIGQIIEKVEKEAFERGYAAGERIGIEMGEKKAAVLIDGIEKILQEMKDIKRSVVEKIEPQLIELSIAIARRIIIEELSLRPEIIVDMTKEAIKKIEKIGQITIKINPALRELFMKLKPELTEIYPDIIFDIDPSISPRGSIVIGHVDEAITDIDSQIKNIIEDIGAKIGRY